MARETEVFSAYYVKLIAHYDRIGLPIDRMLICLSGQHEMKRDFTGFRGFFTLNGYPKPIYNAYVLASRLGREKLEVSGDADENLEVLATRRGDGTVAILLGYADRSFSPSLSPCRLQIALPGLEKKTAKLSIVDRTHANAMYAYAENGSPEHPTDAERETIARLAALSPTLTRVGDGISAELSANAIMLIEIGDVT
jgi:beta-xylosidase